MHTFELLCPCCAYFYRFLYRMLSSPPHQPNQNRLLAALPAAEFERLKPYLELVHLPLGDVLCESGGRLSYVYFPSFYHHLLALYTGEWRVIRDRRGGQ